MSKIKFNLTPQEHIKEIKECGEKFTGSQYYCLYKEDIEKLVKYSEKRDKEIERLNNIINELEKWLNNEITRIQEIDKKSKVKRYGIEQQLDECAINRYKQTKEKIKELKGDGSNE